MKTAFALLMSGIGAVVGALWLIGFTAHHVGLFPAACWQSFWGTVGTGFECCLLGCVIGIVLGAVFVVLFWACLILEDTVIGPIRFERQQEKDRRARLQAQNA